MFAPTQQFAKSAPIPAPSGGINAIANLMSMDPNDAISQFNIVASTSGLIVRKGYREYARIFSGASVDVRTLIPFEGTTTAGDRLFACTLEGIYDISTTGNTYTTAGGIQWVTRSGLAGNCTYTVYTTIAEKYLVVCDEVNGLYTYTESTGVWLRVLEGVGATNVNTVGVVAGVGAPLIDFVYPMVWKSRLWLIQRSTGNAYYGPVGSIYGATAYLLFQFGNKFITGGFLNTLHNFTQDGGNGPDDMLVAISSAGDCVAYMGTNPSNIATFDIVGVWQLGSLPAGRKGVTSPAGDLYVLCGRGVLSLSQLFKGADPGNSPSYITGKINPLVSVDISQNKASVGWALVYHPSEGLLILTVPNTSGIYADYGQYVFDLDTRAWTRFLGVPMGCAAVWKNTLYMGCPSPASDPAALTGRVYTYQDSVDDLASETTSPGAARTGDPINSFLITSFRPQEDGGSNTRMHFIRPQFRAIQTPLYTVDARYDFNVDDTIVVVNGVLVTATAGLWGATWGTWLWGDAAALPVSSTLGATGIGRYSAIALNLRSIYKTTLIGFTGIYDTGGLL